MNIRPLVRGAQLCLSALIGSPLVSAQQLYLIDRAQLLLQTSATAVSSHPSKGNNASAEFPTAVTLTPPAAPSEPITLLRREGAYSYERAFLTKAALDAAFPVGGWRISGAGFSPFTLEVPEITLAENPRLLSTTNGSWTSGGVLIVNPAQATTLNFTTFAEYAAPGAVGFITIEVDGFVANQEDKAVGVGVSNQALLDLEVRPTPITSVTIPANRLVANRLYEAKILYGRIPTLNRTAIPNAIAASVVGYDTRFYISPQTNATPPAPPTVTSQAASRTVASGGSTTITFNYNMPEPGRGGIVRWYRDGIEVDELDGPPRITFTASRNSVTITSLSPEDSGNYSIEVVSAGGVARSAHAVLTVTPPPTPPIPPNAIIGGWSAGDGAANASSVLTFLRNGYYFLAEDGATAAQDGMERGTFSWNETTGAFSALTLMDTNGAAGLSGLGAGARVTISGDTLTLTAGTRTTTYTRITSQTNPLVGSWLLGTGTEVSGSIVFSFLPNGTYFMSDNSDPLDDRSGRKGMERGTYTYDPTTGAFSGRTQSDTNGEWGLSHPGAGQTSSNAILRVAGDTWTVPDPEQPHTFTRVMAPSAPDARLVNLSLRTQVGGNAGMLTVGFVVSGGSATKPVLVRGIGPALGQFGLTGFLADPTLTLFNGTTAVGANDNWNGDAQVRTISGQVGAFEIASATSRDAAIYSAGLAPANYTVQINGVGGGSGDALVEIYDASPAGALSAATPRLANVSAMTRVGGAAGSVLAGFVISGSGPKTVLLRAIGPSLAGFGVSDAIPDPQLRLHGSIFADANDNWGGGAALSSAFAAVGAFALAPGSRDAAVLATLQPGAYTIEVSGVGNASGTALIEVYDVP